MSSTWDKMDRSQIPTMEKVSDYVANPLWNNLCQYIETQYHSKPIFEYSGCSVPGWNVKYRKSGRSLCTLYPMDGYFVALVVIGEHEKNEFDLTLPTLTVYTQQLFESSKDKNGLCWLMFEARDEAVLSDIKHCISIRRGRKKQKS